MNIVNVDSAYDLSAHHLGFARTVLSYFEGGDRYDGMNMDLISDIPIFLFAPSSMPHHDVLNRGVDPWVWEKQRAGSETGEWREDGMPPTERLGFYDPSFTIPPNKSIPIIGLCPERMMRIAKTEDELVLIIAKVLVHEFAHACMDPGRTRDYPHKDEFYVWMEESMANLMTLDCFEDYERSRHRGYRRMRYAFDRDMPRGLRVAHAIQPMDALEYVKAFIDRQPAPYRLAIDLFGTQGIRSYMHRWSFNKAFIAGKTAEKQAWLDHVTTHVGAVQIAELKPLYDALFAR
jgi:hypothetical protein